MPGATGSAGGTPTPLSRWREPGCQRTAPRPLTTDLFQRLEAEVASWTCVIGPTGLSVLLKINVNQNMGGLCAEAAVY